MKIAGKTVCIILVVALLCTLTVSFAGCNKDKKEESVLEYTIGIISDPQIVAASEIEDDDCESFREFDAIGQKMLFISEAILQTAVDTLIAQNVDCVLIPGDLTENGSKVGHETVARECKRLEDAGIPVYAMCGNHDINKDPSSFSYSGETSVNGVSAAEFENIFADYGFDEAVAQDTTTMSYACDLAGSSYRLISVDASNYYRDENGNTHNTGDPKMTEELLSWTKTQIEAANAAGKTPLVTLHFPVVSHFGEVIGALNIEDMRTNMYDEFATMLTQNGVKFVFSGHLHTQDITTYSDEYGTLYDVETGCLSNYPMPIRYFKTYNDKYEITSDYVNAVKAEYVPSYVSAEIKTKVCSDLAAYALEFLDTNMRNNIDNKIEDGLILTVLEMLGLDKDDSATVALANDIYQNLYLKFINKPIYASGGANSLEALAASYGVTLPASSYTNVFNLIINLMGKVFKGDKTMTVDSTEAVLLRYGLYALFAELDTYGLVDKVKALNPNVGNIDLGAVADDLFTTQTIDLGENELLMELISLFEAKMPTLVRDTISGIESTQELLELLPTLLPIAMLALFPEDYDTDTKTVFGIDLNNYFDYDGGKLLLGKLLDEVVWGAVGKGVLYDEGVNDIYLTIAR